MGCFLNLKMIFKIPFFFPSFNTQAAPVRSLLPAPGHSTKMFSGSQETAHLSARSPRPNKGLDSLTQYRAAKCPSPAPPHLLTQPGEIKNNKQANRKNWHWALQPLRSLSRSICLDGPSFEQNHKNLSLNCEPHIFFLFLRRRNNTKVPPKERWERVPAAGRSVLCIAAHCDSACTISSSPSPPEAHTLLTAARCSLAPFALPDMTFKSPRPVPHLLDIVIFSKTFRQLFSWRRLSSPSVNNRSPQTPQCMHVLECLAESGLRLLNWRDRSRLYLQSPASTRATRQHSS